MKWPVLPVSVMVAIALVTSTAACAGDKWRSLGPDGGGVSSVVLDPQNSDTVYALTSGGLFKSTDAGASWTVTTPLPPDSGRVISLVIDPQQTNILYAATAEAAGFVPGRDAVFKSTDGGVTWRALKASGTLGLSAPLAIDPQNPKIIYSGGYNDILKSTDGGETWKAVDSGLPALACCLIVRSLLIDPQNSASIYAVAGIGIFMSGNGGASWTSVYRYSGNFEDPQFATMIMDLQDPRILYGLRIGRGGVYKSTDRGATWLLASTGLPVTPDDTFSISTIAVDPQEPRTLYAATDSGIYRSTDGSESWTMASTGLKNVSSLVIDTQNRGRFYAATQTGIFQSTDRASTWQPKNSGLRATPIWRLALIPQQPAVLYAYSYQNGPLKTADNGANWTLTDFQYPLAIDPANPATMFALVGAALARSTDGGSTFIPSHDGLPGDFCHGITSVNIDSQRAGTMYAGVTSSPCSGTREGGVWKSQDGAVSWKKLSEQPEGGGVYGVALDPKESTTLYAWNGKGVFRSVNGGESWNKLRCGPVSDLALDPHAPGTIYAVINDESSFYQCDHDKPGIFRSTDGGASWTAMNAGLPTIYLNFLRVDSITSLLLDPRENGTLYAGTSANGIFRSTDAGISWEAFNSGLTTLTVFTLAMDPQDSARLYAGTAAGVFVANTR